MNKLRIVIPLYTDKLNQNEWRSLECVDRLLGKKYPITAVCPKGKDLDGIFGKFPTFERCDMAAEYFVSVASYNLMMLSDGFYKNFRDDRFILIYQTDCFLFSDNIEQFLDFDIDYIGAPWVPKTKYGRWYMRAFVGVRKAVYTLLAKQRTHMMLDYHVGNGGLSLRKVEKFIDVTENNKADIAKWLKRNRSFCPEDIYFSIFAKRIRKADMQTGLRFAFDINPNEAYILNHMQLPMGCHAWDRPNMWRFWSQFSNLFNSGKQ